MRRFISHLVHDHTRDIIAIMVVGTWCIAVFLPEWLIDEVTQRAFERILLLVIGFYFGSHKGPGTKIASEQ